MAVKVETKGEKFVRMFELDIQAHAEQLDNGTGFKPTYLSWSSAVMLATQHYEGFIFEFVYNELDGSPVFYNETIDGFFVKTRVSVDGGATYTALSMPVLDNKFKPQGKGQRSYVAKGVTKTILPANSFDINYSQMRCLTKNISIVTGIGLGLYFKEGKKEALHRDQMEKEKLEEMEAERTAMLTAIKDHPLYKEKKTKDWFKAKKNLDVNPSKLEAMEITTLTTVMSLLAKMQEAKEKKEAQAGATQQ